jgi:S-adenosylmethionine synthetase
MEILFEEATGRSTGRRQVEVVERKGLGHPDTICDALAEQVGLALSRHYLERFGAVLHHNVDKVLLVGGSAESRFGGGRVTEPLELFLAGRAVRDVSGERVAVDEIAVETCRRWLSNNLRHVDVDAHVRIHSYIRPGSTDLVEMFGRGADPASWPANDTSIGVGFAPLTDLEQTVLEVERELRGPSVRQAQPEVGEDAKVLGVRRGESVWLTVADAFVDRHLHHLDEYRDKRERLCGAVRELVERQARFRRVDAEVNAADDFASGSVYTTVTGTSAEAGDDGEAGRGNRVSGLITPYRPMTMESVAGKNPVSHVGKIYNVAAGRIAASLADDPRVEGAECYLVSRIGQPVTEPQTVHFRIRPTDGQALASMQDELDERARQALRGMGQLWKELVQGEGSV